MPTTSRRSRASMRLLACLLLVAMLFTSVGTASAAPGDPPGYFSETGFGITEPKFWEYFSSRGGIRTFGYPVSRTFTLEGFKVQIFQRRVLQLGNDDRVNQLNLLESPFLPYTSFNNAIVPAQDAALVQSAPAPGSPEYATAVIQFVRSQAPNTFNGLQTNFEATFTTSVTMQEAYPRGGGNAGLLAGIHLEMWGIPTSRPAADPNNPNFVYQRFQRGIMHFDRATLTTQGLLLGDYFKSILTGRNLPPDLAAQASGSRYLARYNNAAPNGVGPGAPLANTDLRNAFEKQAPTAAPAAPAAPAPAAPGTSVPAAPVGVASIPASPGACIVPPAALTLARTEAGANGSTVLHGTIHNTCSEPASFAVDAYARASIDPNSDPLVDAPTLFVDDVQPGATVPISVTIPQSAGAAAFSWQQFSRVGEDRTRPTCLNPSLQPITVGSSRCLLIDPRLWSSTLALLHFEEGRELVSISAQGGIRMIRDEVPERSYAFYRPRTRTITLDRNLDATSTWARATVLAHELQHAVFHVTGEGAQNESQCYLEEENAFRTETRIWLAFWRGRLPPPIDQVHDEQNRIARAIERDPAGFVAALQENYRAECSAAA